MASAGAHVAYRDRLMALTTDALLLETMHGSIVGSGGHAARWRRVYGRFSPGSSAYALVVLERVDPAPELRTCEVFEREPIDTGHEHVARHDALGWVAWSSFPHDRRLPTLAAALTRVGPATVVRYRPGKRCTVRVEHGADTFFCKVFPDASGARLHAEAQDLWRAGARGELGFAVAEPVRWDGETRTLWQRSIGGTSIYPRLTGPDGPAFARRLGAAAGTLPGSSVRPNERFDADTQCRRSTSYARELGARIPTLASLATALVTRLAECHRARHARPRVIHGAPHMNQWLDVGGGRLGLVDFDRLSIGDPELDVSTFLGELDFEDGLAHGVDAIADAFIGGYEETGGPLDEPLLQAYRSHKRLAKALRSARALRVDGALRAERHLRTAFAALDARGAA